MYINEKTAISTSRCLLVPYCESHVLPYHEWMKDPEIQEATASEPLTIEEEYQMQRSWRKDCDKLTFITCIPLPRHHKFVASHSSAASSNSSSRSNVDLLTPDSNPYSSSPQSHPSSHQYHLPANTYDTSTQMRGDVNMFLTRSDGGLIGEIELMIACKEHQGKGLGRATLLAFLRYILSHESEIVAQYLAGDSRYSSTVPSAVPSPHSSSTSLHQISTNTTITPLNASGQQQQPTTLTRLSAKISSTNTRSLALFRSVGFQAVSEEPNVFGELELRLEGVTIFELEEMLERHVVEGYVEVEYRER